jgi:aldehyde:ferredoxin oxidoreductase
MPGGYMDRILTVDLTHRRMESEGLSEGLSHEYVGGYGLGARLLYDRMPAGADPLGPDNILGILTGPLTGTPALIGSRFVLVGKSPKTGGWGDGNCGGFFGGALKRAGLDGIILRGMADKPVYLLVEDGKAELRDAGDLWGMNVSDLEDALQARHGKDAQVASIGPAGEKLSYLAAVMNDRERAAARSGLGAVMGSKRLKAVVVRGKMSVPLHDAKRLNAMRRKLTKEMSGLYPTLREWGTAGLTADASLSGDSPVKNWGGAGTVDFPMERASKIGGDSVNGVAGYKRYACSGCPIGCGGTMRQDTGPFALQYNNGKGHKPEYETLAMLGSNLLNDDLPSIIRLNELCNAYGIDTIALGGVLGWVIECHENGLLSARDLDGLEMRWGNAPAIVSMAEKIVKREGVGDLLADGVKVAWEKMDHIGTEYAIHVGGEEIPAHDPRFTPGVAMTYYLAPTPGRHTQGGELLGPPSGLPLDRVKKYTYTGLADNHWKLVTSFEVSQSSGACMFAYLSLPLDSLADQLEAVTGWQYSGEEMFRTGERIFTMRHLFNLREGQNPLARNVPGRIVGKPPLTEGNVKGVSVDLKTLTTEFLARLDWDPQTSIPSAERLSMLNMDFAVADRPDWKVPAVEIPGQSA